MEEKTLVELLGSNKEEQEAYHQIRIKAQQGIEQIKAYTEKTQEEMDRLLKTAASPFKYKLVFHDGTEIKSTIQQYENEVTLLRGQAEKAEQFANQMGLYLNWVTGIKDYISPIDEVYPTLEILSHDLKNRSDNLKDFVIRRVSLIKRYETATNELEDMLK